MNIFSTGLLCVASFLFGLYIWVKSRHSYWRRKNVPFIKPHLVFGNFKEMLTMSCNLAEQFYSMYFDKETKDEPVTGIYVMDRPGLLIRDLNLVKSILLKDFHKFPNRSPQPDRHNDVIGSYNLTTVKIPEWRQLRTMASPVFTSAKLKEMLPLMNEIGITLDKHCCNLPSDPKTNSCIAEVREVSALYTTDIISSVAYGVQADTLTNPKSEFRTKARTVTDFSPMRALEFYTIFFLHKFVRVLRYKFFGKIATKFLRTTMRYLIQERIKTGNRRNDLIDILIAFKKSIEIDKLENESFFDEVLIAQAAIFYVAGFETTSSAMSFILFELSRNPDVQKRLRQEIKEALVKHDGKVSYDMIREMEYLDMVIKETLRLYPPIVFLNREAILTEDDKEYSLEPYSDFKVPHKMCLYIPIFSIHRDPKYHPNPEKFDPERFSPTNRENIHPMSFLPFGVGPRVCMGQRFAYIQTKVGLIYILRNHYVTTCERSFERMIFEPKAAMLQPKDGIYCKFVKDPLIKT